MTKRFKTAFASLAVATLCTLGVSSQASAFDLLEELLGGTKYGADYADACGCSQKSGHVQRCGSDCGGKGVSGPAQQSGGHVQHVDHGKGGNFGGHAQHSDGKGGHIGGHAQHSDGKGGHFGGHAQRASCGKGHCGEAKKGGSSKSTHHRIDLLGMFRAKMAGSKGKGNDGDKGYDLDFKSGGYGDGKSMIVPAPVFSEDFQAIPVPSDPDPAT